MASIAALAGPGRAAASDRSLGVALPAVFEGGRIFATPRVANGGGPMRLWLDTDGAGFVFAESVDRLKLSAVDDPHRPGRWARLPAFTPGASIPRPRGGHLRIFVRDDEAMRDPILRGFDGQLGASWFQGRAWTFDYPARRVLLRSGAADADGSRVTVRFPNDDAKARIEDAQYPRIVVCVGGRPHLMAFDTAATVALTERSRERFADGLPALRATSFVRRSVFDAWREAHPEWPVLHGVSVTPAIDAIRAASVRLGAAELGASWFTTRPHDDVFDGVDEHLDGKLGGPAFLKRVVTIDYPRAILAVR